MPGEEVAGPGKAQPIGRPPDSAYRARNAVSKVRDTRSALVSCFCACGVRVRPSNPLRNRHADMRYLVSSTWRATLAAVSNFSFTLPNWRMFFRCDLTLVVCSSVGAQLFFCCWPWWRWRARSPLFAQGGEADLKLLSDLGSAKLSFLGGVSGPTLLLVGLGVNAVLGLVFGMAEMYTHLRKLPVHASMLRNLRADLLKPARRT